MGWRPTYADEGDLKLTVDLGDNADDTEIAAALEAASRVIDHDCGRQFGALAAPEERVYEARWDPIEALWVAEIDDLMTTTGLVVDVDGSPLAASEYRLGPRNAVADGRPWEYIHTDTATTPTLGNGRRTLEITAQWGWVDSGDAEATPTAIKRATILLGQRFWARHEAPLGITGSPEMVGQITLEDHDPDVAAMVRPFWRLSQARGFA